jgi:hypothetical protein
VIPGIGLGNIMEILKNAGKFQREAEGLKDLVVEGSAGGGMVRVRITGKGEMLDCKIEPQLFSDHDAEMLEDLIVAATNQGLKKVMQAWVEKFGFAFSGMNLPMPELLGPSGKDPKGT